MVPYITRQSVIIKCNMNKSVLTGNYEYYYAAGLAEKLMGISIPEEIKPEDLKTLLTKQLTGMTGGDEKESYLLQLLMDYTPGDAYDAQMKELLLMGKEEKNCFKLT